MFLSSSIVFLLCYISVTHKGLNSVAFAVVAPGCTRFLCQISGFVESLSTGDRRQPQAGGAVGLEAALLMLLAGKRSSAEASCQN